MSNDFSIMKEIGIIDETYNDHLYNKYGIVIVNDKIYILGTFQIIIIDMFTFKKIETIDYEKNIYYGLKYGLVVIDGILYFKNQKYRYSYDTNRKTINKYDIKHTTMPDYVEYTKHDGIYYGMDNILSFTKIIEDKLNLYIYGCSVCIHNNLLYVFDVTDIAIYESD